MSTKAIGKAAPSTEPFSKMGPQIIQHTASFLDPTASYRMMRVCQTWKNAVSDAPIWKNHYQAKFANTIMEISPKTPRQCLQILRKQGLVKWETFEKTPLDDQEHLFTINDRTYSQDCIFTLFARTVTYLPKSGSAYLPFILFPSTPTSILGGINKADGKLFVGHINNTVSVCDINSKKVDKLLETSAEVTCIAQHDDMLLVGCKDGHVFVYSIPELVLVSAFNEDSGAVASLIVRRGKLFAGSLSDTQSIRIGNIASGTWDKTFSNGRWGGVTSLEVHDNILFAGGKCNPLFIWNLNTDHRIAAIDNMGGPMKRYPINGLKWINGSLYALRKKNWNNTEQVWKFDFYPELPSRSTLAKIRIIEQRLMQRGVAPDGMALFTQLAFPEKEEIYQRIWEIKGSPMDLHPKLGELSFERNPQLDTLHHAKDAEQLNAVRGYRFFLQNALSLHGKLTPRFFSLEAAVEKCFSEKDIRLHLKIDAEQQAMQEMRKGGISHNTLLSLDSWALRYSMDTFLWKLKGSPAKAHPQFGNESFWRTKEISPHFHATDKERMITIRAARFISQAHLTWQDLRCVSLEQLPHSSFSTAALGRLMYVEEQLGKNNEKEALTLFSGLTQHEKNSVYVRIWELKGSPKNIHCSFGELAFNRSKELPPQHHATDAERTEAVRGTRAAIEQALTLYTYANRPLLTENYLQERIALIIYGLRGCLRENEDTETDITFALQLLDNLSLQEQDEIYLRLWKIKGEPQDIHSNFGALSFHHSPLLNIKYHASDKERIDAVVNYFLDLVTVAFQ